VVRPLRARVARGWRPELGQLVRRSGALGPVAQTNARPRRVVDAAEGRAEVGGQGSAAVMCGRRPG
jgi:hypothetical protein